MNSRIRSLIAVTGSALALALSLAPVAALPAAAAPVTAGTTPVVRAENGSDGTAGPAPQTRERRIISNVHTDTVSSFVDDGKFTLGSKADINGQTGYRIDNNATVFHLEDAARQSTSGAPDFLRRLGNEMWMAPQTQDRRLIWPGFSTENEALADASDNQKVSLELINVQGPGRVELFLNDLGGPSRVFSSHDKLPPYTMGMRQHTHMNWAFAAPGHYELKFRASTQIGGATQRAETTYTFYVGPASKMTSEIGMTVMADQAIVDESEPFTFTAVLDPKHARGAVEFTDTTTGVLLGHSPVTRGRAQLRTAALNPGKHEVTARFVPTWADEFRPVAVQPGQGLNIQVRGEVAERPTDDDTQPIADAQLTAATRTRDVRVPAASKSVTEHSALTVEARAAAGEWVSVWIHTTAGQRWVGWVQVTADGRLSAPIDGSARGDAKVVLKDEHGTLIGWDSFTITKLKVRPGEMPQQPPSRGGAGGNGGGGTGSGGNVGASPNAAGQTCQPAIVLDHGHIDAFNVSASKGGTAVLQLKEDVTGAHVLHEAEEVLLRVNPGAHDANIPASLPGAPSGYVLPLAQRSDLIWPGWDTNRTNGSGYTDVQIHIHSVEGPGSVHLYSMGSFGDLKPLLAGGSTRLPGTLREPSPAHTHAQWVFSTEGIYVLSVSATATNPATGQRATTATHRYVFQVGDAPLGDVFCKVRPSADARAQSAAVAQDVADQEAEAAQAAEQAEAEAEEEARRHAANGGSGEDVRVMDADADAPLTATERDTLLIGAALGGGGALVIGGIGYSTFWYLRRLRTTE